MSTQGLRLHCQLQEVDAALRTACSRVILLHNSIAQLRSRPEKSQQTQCSLTQMLRLRLSTLERVRHLSDQMDELQGALRALDGDVARRPGPGAKSRMAIK